MVQGLTHNIVEVASNHNFVVWIKDVCKRLTKSGKDCTLWPDLVKPVPNPILHGANTDLSLIGLLGSSASARRSCCACVRSLPQLQWQRAEGWA